MTKQIVFSVPTNEAGMHHLAITKFIHDAVRPCRERGYEFVWNIIPAQPNTTTRNLQTNQFMWAYPDAVALVFCDSDAIPDVNGLMRLIDAIEHDDVDVCFGWSLIVNDGELRPNVVGEPNKEFGGARKTDTVTPHREPGLFEITGGACGSHCMIVKRRVLQEMFNRNMQIFEDLFYKVPEDEPKHIQDDWRNRRGTRKRGHDYLFCERVAELGFRVWLDNRVYWGHSKTVDLRYWYNQVYAISKNVQAQRHAIDLLRELWGNEDWTASTEFLMRAANEAIRVPHDRAILELGSGLSTAVLSKAHPNVVALESEGDFLGTPKPQWAPNSTVLDALLENYGDYDWYAKDAVEEALSGKPIGLLIVDGPVGTTRGGRIGCINLRDRLAPGCVVMFDDVNRPAEIALVEEWCKPLGEVDVSLTRCDDGRSFAVLTMPKE